MRDLGRWIIYEDVFEVENNYDRFTLIFDLEERILDLRGRNFEIIEERMMTVGLI